MAATTETFVPDRHYKTLVADLQPAPNQSRKYPAAVVIDELTTSGKGQKVIAPIVFLIRYWPAQIWELDCLFSWSGTR